MRSVRAVGYVFVEIVSINRRRCYYCNITPCISFTKRRKNKKYFFMWKCKSEHFDFVCVFNVLGCFDDEFKIVSKLIDRHHRLRPTTKIKQNTKLARTKIKTLQFVQFCVVFVTKFTTIQNVVRAWFCFIVDRHVTCAYTYHTQVAFRLTTLTTYKCYKNIVTIISFLLF